MDWIVILKKVNNGRALVHSLACLCQLTEESHRRLRKFLSTEDLKLNFALGPLVTHVLLGIP
jgi:hypothetical protein